MTRVKIISDVNIAEGIVASLVFPSVIYYFKYDKNFTAYLTTMLSWFITWVLRKFTVNAITTYKINHNIPIKYYYLDLPLSL